VASFKNPIQRLAARIFENEDSSPFVTTESQRADCPGEIKFGGE
jgi:hypothetical protein